ncbi:hypothetical protein HY495_02855 [Candidatus Woesearchaeota archaeon]|nr:hypothetical protein [Candidatus Woesearchaeota archaeon]
MTDSRNINNISQLWGGQGERVRIPAKFNVGKFSEFREVVFDLRRDIDLGGRVSSAYVELHESSEYQPPRTFYKVLAEKGYRPISLEETAILRILGGANIYGRDMKEDRFPVISDKDSTTKEAFVYVPGKGLFLSRNSPLMEEPEEVIKKSMYDDIDEHYLTDEQVEKALADAVKISDNSGKRISAIPTRRFAESEIANWAFGGAAEDYGYFLDDCLIKSMPIYWRRAKNEEKPFSRQAVLRDLWVPLMGEKEGYSALSGTQLVPHYVRGIKVQEAELSFERLRDRISPTKFQRYLNKPRKLVEAVKNPQPTPEERNKSGMDIINQVEKDLAGILIGLAGLTDPHPEIARLSDAFGSTLDEEMKMREAYDKLQDAFKE